MQIINKLTLVTNIARSDYYINIGLAFFQYRYPYPKRPGQIDEGFYNFSDICVPVDLFTPSLYKFDVTGKDIEDNHTMEHEHNKFFYSIYR